MPPSSMEANMSRGSE